MRASVLFAVFLSASSQIAAQTAVVNLASFEEFRPVAPNGLATIFGDFGIEASRGAAEIPWPQELEGFEIFVDGQPAGLGAVAPGQINFQVPGQLVADPYGETSPVEVRRDGVTVAQTALLLRETSPAIFVNAADPARPAIALNEDDSLNSEQSPIRTGEALRLFLTGQGSAFISPELITPPRTTIQPDVYFRTYRGETQESVLPDGMPGVWQVDVRVPEIPDFEGGQVPVTVSFGGHSSNTASVWMQP